MKTTLLIISLFFLGCTQVNHSKLTYDHTTTDLEIVTINDTLQFTSTIAKIDLNKIKTNKGIFYHLTLDKYIKSGEVGQPQLASISKMLKVPTSFHPKIILDPSRLSSELVRLKKHKLLPLQTSVNKPDSIGVMSLSDYNETYYVNNKWTDNELVQLEKVGKTKSHVLYRLTINPIRYNPRKNHIKLFTEIQGTIQFVSDQDFNN